MFGDALGVVVVGETLGLVGDVLGETVGVVPVGAAVVGAVVVGMAEVGEGESECDGEVVGTAAPPQEKKSWMAGKLKTFS